LNTNRADLHLDLTGATEVELRFWFKEFSDEFHAEDGVFLSDDGGATFTQILALSGTGTYAEYMVDLDAEAMAHGLSLTATTVVRFQQRDNSTISGDGFAFDDINVHVPPGSRLTAVPSMPADPARKVSLYPNPARDQVVLAIAGPGADQPATVTFYGLDGRMALQQRLPATGTGSANQLAIGDLPAGTYLVEVTSGTHRDVLRLVKP
ncbi:MAG: T9SS type A sorting domain-containing protein, partial [Bacteroidota bacterium]